MTMTIDCIAHAYQELQTEGVVAEKICEDILSPLEWLVTITRWSGHGQVGTPSQKLRQLQAVEHESKVAMPTSKMCHQKMFIVHTLAPRCAKTEIRWKSAVEQELCFSVS